MPRHEHPEKTKSEILKTASRLFLEKGWENVTIQDVVKEVGVTRGAFYHYFKSREDLVGAAMEQIFIENNPFILASKEKGLNGLEKLRFALIHAASLNSNAALASDMQKLISNPVVFKNEYYHCVNNLAPYIEKLLEEGNEDGSISVTYPKQTAQTIAILINMWLNPAVFQVSRQEFTDKILYLGELSEQLGIPVMDNELKETLLQFYESYNQN